MYSGTPSRCPLPVSAVGEIAAARQYEYEIFEEALRRHPGPATGGRTGIAALTLPARRNSRDWPG